MNTLTHALMGSAVFGHPRLTIGLMIATFWGGIFPDVSIVAMVIWESGIQGASSAELWGEAYYREPWVTYSAITNSFIVFGALFALARLQGWYLVAAFAGTAMLHFLFDLFLHYDDGHAHFWPLSQCVFYSPVSYWDPDHFGLWWTGIEMALALGLFIWIWKTTKTWPARTYASVLMVLFWAMSVAFLIMVLSFGGMDDRPESSGHDKFAQPACPGSIDVAKQHVQNAH